MRVALQPNGFKQWASAWFARNEIRGAVRAEINGVIITLNFFILSASEPGAAEDVVLKYFPAPPPPQIISVLLEPEARPHLEAPGMAQVERVG